MEKNRILSILLALVFTVTLATTSISAASQNNFRGSQFPTVMVHGMMGWGDYESFNKTVDYYGMTSGSIRKHLKGEGYHDLYEASVGPLSSGWDRACELYAQLTGTRVDYGAAHSEKYGHARYGRDYSKNPLIPGYKWNANNKVNLVGHSFGATTIRLMHDMLADGRPEEVQAAKKAGTSPSPLFTGGKRDYVYSITTISGTNNGTSYCYAYPILTPGSVHVYQAWCYMLSAIGASEGIHDFQLDQFGISANDRMSWLQILNNTDFLSHNDAGICDFEVDRAMKLNEELQVQPNTFYFCCAGNASQKKPDGTYGPINKAFVVLKPFISRMGSYLATTKGSFPVGYGEHQTTATVTPTVIDEKWLPNDGFVNVIAEQVPFRHSGSKLVYDPSETYSDSTRLRPGRWYVMPVYTGDHLGTVGGLGTEKASEVFAYYDDLFRAIYRTKN